MSAPEFPAWLGQLSDQIEDIHEALERPVTIVVCDVDGQGDQVHSLHFDMSPLDAEAVIVHLLHDQLQMLNETPEAERCPSCDGAADRARRALAILMEDAEDAAPAGAVLQ